VHGVVPLIQQLNAQADEWRAPRSPAPSKLLAKGEDVDAVLEALSRGLTQKMLHGTLAELRAATLPTAQTVSRLFLRSAPKRPVSGACPLTFRKATSQIASAPACLIQRYSFTS
jgi:glutamyl-tRNA reductase